jgi:hypothetical protein
MNESSEPDRRELEEAQQIERWVRRYAQNRSLPVAVAVTISALLFLAISLASLLGGIAYRNGDTALFAVCIGVVAVAMVATIYISIPRWGGRRLQQLAERLYDAEGSVTIATPRAGRPGFIALLGLTFGACVLGQVILGVLGYLPTDEYMQPISAIYVVPFLVALNFLMRPATSNLHLLWPLLYALHALLILAGAPIAFQGGWEILNMLMPVAGYGLVTSLIAHIYSRWALHSVRTIVGRQLDEAQLQNDAGGA